MIINLCATTPDRTPAQSTDATKYARTARRDNTVFYLLKEAYNRQRQRHVKSRIFKTLKKGVIHTLDSDGGICDTTSRMMVYKAYEEMKVVSR